MGADILVDLYILLVRDNQIVHGVHMDIASLNAHIFTWTFISDTLLDHEIICLLILSAGYCCGCMYS